MDTGKSVTGTCCSVSVAGENSRLRLFRDRQERCLEVDATGMRYEQFLDAFRLVCSNTQPHQQVAFMLARDILHS